MAGSEAARLDPYNGLTELLGPERAETLMSNLPNYDLSDLATKVDIAGLVARIDGLEMKLAAVDTTLMAIGSRLDRLFLPLVAGLLVIVATMVGISFSPG